MQSFFAFEPQRGLVIPRSAPGLTGWAPCLSSALITATLVVADAAQAFEPVQGATSGAQTVVRDSDIGFRRGNFIAAPIPLTSDTIGNGLVVGGGYLFTLPGSVTSGFGLGYLETDNGTTGYAFGGNVNFDDGRWTTGGGYADLDLKYDLPVSGALDLPLTQSINGYVLRFDYGLTDNIRAGFAYAYADSFIAVESDFLGTLPDFLQPDLDLEIHRVTLDLAYDTRDDTIFPRSGILVSGNLTYAHVEEAGGGGSLLTGQRDYSKVLLSFAAFDEIIGNGVAAVSAVICGAQEEAPFFDGCGVGFVDGLRGFSALDALADWSAAAQAEYRGRFSDRFGYTVFAGAGAGGDALDTLSLDQGGVAYGAGLRYRLSKQNQLDYSIDYAVNEDGDGLLYLYVGQRF